MADKAGRIILLICLAVLTSSRAYARPDGTQAGAPVSAATLEAHIRFLSDDLLGGRAPGSMGSHLAQLYIISQMRLAGLQPGASDTSFYQRFKLVSYDVGTDARLEFSGTSGSLAPEFYDEFIAFPGVEQDAIRLDNAGLVFVGYGIQAPEYGWDDFKDADLRGKVLLIMNNDPDTGDPQFFGGKARLYYGRWDYKYEQAARMGAAGAIIIHTTPSAGYPWKVVQSSWSGTQFKLPQTGGSSLKYKGWVTEEVARQIAELGGKNLDSLRAAAQHREFRPVDLGLQVNGTLDTKFGTIQAANVIGVLPGSDPQLRDQAVVFSAHYDHLGVGTAVDGDSIYNGAVDNASGVASILALAKAYSELGTPPRRTLVFLACDAEESGLLGSQYYAEHPTFPPGKIAADVNIDGCDIWGRTRDISMIGAGKSTVDNVVREIAAGQGRVLKGDLMPEQGSLYRADQLNFAKIGVPALYLDTGQDFIGRPEGWGKQAVEHWIDTHYHQPSDEFDGYWDMSGFVEDMELIYKAGLRLADDDAMPTWLPGDEFEAARLKSQ